MNENNMRIWDTTEYLEMLKLGLGRLFEIDRGRGSIFSNFQHPWVYLLSIMIFQDSIDFFQILPNTNQQMELFLDIAQWKLRWTPAMPGT